MSPSLGLTHQKSCSLDFHQLPVTFCWSFRIRQGALIFFQCRKKRNDFFPSLPEPEFFQLAVGQFMKNGNNTQGEHGENTCKIMKYIQHQGGKENKTSPESGSKKNWKTVVLTSKKWSSPELLLGMIMMIGWIIEVGKYSHKSSWA